MFLRIPPWNNHLNGGFYIFLPGECPGPFFFFELLCSLPKSTVITLLWTSEHSGPFLSEHKNSSSENSEGINEPRRSETETQAGHSATCCCRSSFRLIRDELLRFRRLAAVHSRCCCFLRGVDGASPFTAAVVECRCTFDTGIPFQNYIDSIVWPVVMCVCFILLHMH